MTRQDPHDPNASTRVGRDAPASGTSSGADVTSRMAGTHGDVHDETQADRPRHASHDHDTHVTPVATHDRDLAVGRAKTSAAAAFALVFGLAALFCALTGILAPAAVLFGLIGIVVGIAGMKMTRRPGVTGRGVAIGGLVTAILGFLLGAAVIAGVAVYVNDQGLDNLEQQIDNVRDDLPSGQDIVEQVPGN